MYPLFLSADEIPKPCSRKDPNYVECTRNYIKSILHPLASKGIKSLNVPAWDPFLLPFIDVNFGYTENFYVKALLKDLSAKGVSNYLIEDIK